MRYRRPDLGRLHLERESPFSTLTWLHMSSIHGIRDILLPSASLSASIIDNASRGADETAKSVATPMRRTLRRRNRMSHRRRQLNREKCKLVETYSKFDSLRKCSYLREEKHYSPILVAESLACRVLRQKKIPQMPLWALQPLLYTDLWPSTPALTR